MASSLGQVLTLIVGSLGSLLILAVLLRFLLQASRADFYNPVSQAIVKATSPVLNPLRKIIPGYGGIDFAALVLALLLNIIATTIMILAAGYSLPNIGTIVGWSFIGLVAFILNIYFYSLIISIVSSWIAPYSGNPILLLVQQLLEPIQSRVRKIIPPMGGLDFSPIFIFLAIQVLEIMLVNSLANSMLLRPDLVIGI
jgi:YggT family protein